MLCCDAADGRHTPCPTASGWVSNSSSSPECDASSPEYSVALAKNAFVAARSVLSSRPVVTVPAKSANASPQQFRVSRRVWTR
jgi:hypothetical protein